MTWPALPASGSTRLLALLHQLEQTEWWSTEELLEAQLDQLQLLMHHAARSVPFYAARFKAAGVDPTRPVGPEELSRIAVLRRGDLQRLGKELLSQALPASHGHTSEVSTSGSTGRRVTVTKTALADHFWHAITLRSYLWARRDFRGRLAMIRYVKERELARAPGGQPLENWGPMLGELFDTGPAVLLRNDTDVEVQCDWLLAQDPDYLITNPSNLRALARALSERGVRPRRLKEISTVSEVVTSELRALCRDALGAPITDMYSSQETGYVALQCPEHEHYHVQSENALVEVLDEQGRACAVGQTGRVVVTPLHNYAMPLVRYDIGDYAQVGPPCPCGRGLPVLTRIAGRYRNLLRLPNGERHWPVLSDEVFLGIAPIVQFQFVQTSLDEIELKVISRRALQDTEIARLADHVRRTLGHPFRVRVTPCATIPRSPAGKYEDFRSEIEDA